MHLVKITRCIYKQNGSKSIRAPIPLPSKNGQTVESRPKTCPCLGEKYACGVLLKNADRVWSTDGKFECDVVECGALEFHTCSYKSE